ncbi:HAD-IIB family hydrolase [Bremerella cremea]|uniref:HAD-IIB family hydrolase n=1 Tax=Bremerella cremea TaxID=1031537 RepID=A0A368KXC4_9BACT|nr:HAD-IIB family hydrolase [Bremerella cremea]RCS54305.1 HAD-IIB family hydrolase [Bremerella cremea]
MNKVLATDLDGTFIPLENHPENERDLSLLGDHLAAQNVTLTFVTGRHLSSVQDAIQRHSLPQPDWVICDVGTSIYHRDGEEFHIANPYVQHLQSIVGEYSTKVVRQKFSAWDALRLQEQEKQGTFKLSFYCDATQVKSLVQMLRQALAEHAMPYNVIGSVDPFNGDGLIDLLPADVSKAHALQWWTKHTGLANEETVFAGDSGNDLAALTAGYRTIVVGNADRALAETVRTHFENCQQLDRLYLAEKTATSGVLAGCQHFGLV